MQTILVMDEKNYTEKMRTFERFGVRAIIRKNGLFAMQQSGSGEYKIPGGGMDPGETTEEALAREVLEETGLVVIPESIRPIGEILEMRKDIFDDRVKFVSHTMHYICDVTDEIRPTHMTESEKRKGFHLAWADMETIIETNERLMKENWQFRDVNFLKWFREQEIK